MNREIATAQVHAKMRSLICFVFGTSLVMNDFVKRNVPGGAAQ